MHPAKAYARVMDMLDSYKHRLRKAAAAFCAAAFLLGSVPAARAASVCPPPQVSAACAALIDGRTGQTLYEKDAAFCSRNDRADAFVFFKKHGSGAEHVPPRKPVEKHLPAAVSPVNTGFSPL